MKAPVLRPAAIGAALLLTATAFTGCLKEKETKQVKFTANVPIYLTYEELRSPVEVTGPTQLEKPGKIYIYNDYVFVSDQDRGIHVYDDINGAQPAPIAFIKLPGVRDVAVSNDVLYANSFVDLVSFDISDINNITQIDRDEHVLPIHFPEFDEEHYIYQYEPEKGVVIGWEVKEIETTCPNRECMSDPGEFFDARNNGFGDAALAASGSGSGKSSVGTAGSITRFMIHDDFLYIIDDSDMGMFDISSPRNPTYTRDAHIGQGIETLHKSDDMLFVGSETGMFIYSMEDAGNPEFISEFTHVTGCDPVVVQDKYAYVTIRGGTDCNGGWNNQLDIIDISNPETPILMTTVGMTEPYGLGVDGTTLFVCDGNAGTKVYDISDPVQTQSNQINTINKPSYDVIVHDGVLSLIGPDGLHQYDVNNPEDIRYLSTIAW